MLGCWSVINTLHYKSWTGFGGLAQLARAPALQAGGQRFESVILHSQVSLTFDEVISSLIVPHPSLDKIFDILTQAKL